MHTPLPALCTGVLREHKQAHRPGARCASTADFGALAAMQAPVCEGIRETSGCRVGKGWEGQPGGEMRGWECVARLVDVGAVLREFHLLLLAAPGSFL